MADTEITAPEYRMPVAALDAHPWPLPDGALWVRIDMYVFTDELGRERLGVYGMLPTRRWRRLHLYRHAIDALERALEDEIGSRP